MIVFPSLALFSDCSVTSNDFTLFGIFSHLRVKKRVAVIGTGVVLIWLQARFFLNLSGEAFQSRSPNGSILTHFGESLQRKINFNPTYRLNLVAIICWYYHLFFKLLN